MGSRKSGKVILPFQVPRVEARGRGCAISGATIHAIGTLAYALDYFGGLAKE
jgi:hypothetical protein